jgi:hypothetical protein
LLVLHYEGQKLLHSMLAQFGSRATIVQRGKASGTQWHPQNDAVFASQEDMGDILRCTRDPLDTKSFSKEWLARIGHLGPGIIWVVEVGIKKWCGSTRFRKIV